MAGWSLVTSLVKNTLSYPLGRRNDGVRDMLNRQRNWETWTERRLEDGARNGKCIEDDYILCLYGRVTFELVHWL
jgi:hypothetical protein